jgi:hypothetical protein
LVPDFARQPLVWTAPVIVGVMVVIGVYGINWRIYQSAQLITERRSYVDEVVADLDHFPPLATFARERLLNVMSSTLDHFTRSELIPSLPEQADIAIKAEPDNMHLRFAVAHFYRTVANSSPDLIALPRFHTDMGIRLGPNTASAAQALEEQLASELDLAS